MAVHLGNDSAARRQQRLEPDLERNTDRDADAGSDEPAAPQAARPADPAALSRLLPPSPRDPNAQRARRGLDADDAEGGPRHAAAVEREESGERVWRGRGPRRFIDDTAPPLPSPRTTPSPTTPPATSDAALPTPLPLMGNIDPALRGSWNFLPDLGNFAIASPATPPPAPQAANTAVVAPSGPHNPYDVVMAGGATADGGGGVMRAAPLPTAPRIEVAGLNLMLADPLVQEMIAAHAPAVRDLGNGDVARGLVARYGVNLAQRLDQYSRATAGVRAAYVQAVEDIRLPVGGLYAVSQMQPPAHFADGQLGFDPFTFFASGGLNPFNLATFTAEYSQGASVSQRAFAMLYGAGAERLELTPGNIIETTTTDPYSHEGVGRGVDWRPTALSSGPETGSLDAVAPPRLYRTDAVGFDPAFGWVTSSENIYVHQDGLSRLADQVFPVFFGAVITWATVGTGSSIAASVTQSTGSTLAGTAAGAASVAAVGSAATQFAATGSIDFRQLLRTTLSGAITGGLLDTLGVSAQQLRGAQFAQRMLGLTGAATVQGALQEVLGGRFRDGFTNAMAGGLANEIGQALQGQFAQLQGLGPVQQSAFRLLTQATTSAVRALANPGDANYAFAQSFLSELVGDGLNGLAPAPTATAPTPATVPPAFDDDSNLMPGVVDSLASLEQQQTQLQSHLLAQGIDATQASSLASAHYAAPILIRDEAAREAQQAGRNDEALQGLDVFEPGSSAAPLADASGAATPRLLRLQANLARLTEADSLYLIERNQAVLAAQIDKYGQLEAQALQSGDAALARALRGERSLFEGTQQQLAQRAVAVDYRGAALRYAGDLAGRGGSPHSAQELTQAMQRLVAGTSQDGNAADVYLRERLASDDKRLLLTIMGGGSIMALVGSDGSGAGMPRLQRTPNGSVQVPGSGYRYNFDGLGRVDNARAELRLGEGTRNADQQRNAGGSDRRTTDDGGHIVGNRFNPPTEEFNLFAQDANFNRGAYRVLENRWAQALAEGKSVTVEWNFRYSGSSARPDRLLVVYRVGNEPAVTAPFLNVPGGGK